MAPEHNISIPDPDLRKHSPPCFASDGVTSVRGRRLCVPYRNQDVSECLQCGSATIASRNIVAVAGLTMEVCRANGYRLELKCDRRDIKRRGWWKAEFPGFWSLLLAACMVSVLQTLHRRRIPDM